MHIYIIFVCVRVCVCVCTYIYTFFVIIFLMNQIISYFYVTFSFITFLFPFYFLLRSCLLLLTQRIHFRLSFNSIIKIIYIKNVKSYIVSMFYFRNKTSINFFFCYLTSVQFFFQIYSFAFLFYPYFISSSMNAVFSKSWSIFLLY